MLEGVSVPSLYGSWQVFGASWRFLAFDNSFRHVALAGTCLPILRLFLFDFGRCLADIGRTIFAFYKFELQTFANTCLETKGYQN